jgi:hypothetical protein
VGCYSEWTSARVLVGVLTTNVRTLVFALLIGYLSACTTIPVDERAEIREEVDQVVVETIAQMVAVDSALQQPLDEVVSYADGPFIEHTL